MAHPDTPTDAALLLAWSQNRCQESFNLIVRKYLGLVHGVALRRTGDPDLARDISQKVFILTARKAGHLRATPSLAPWLHHCAWCETLSAMRHEATRLRHMQLYTQLTDPALATNPPDDLHPVIPLLDEALQRLSRADRDVVLMRFYEDRGLQDIAGVLGKTEAAVRKQCQRALEKLTGHLRRRGVTIPCAGLAAGLGSVLLQPAPGASVVMISTTAIAAGGAQAAVLSSFLATILMNAKLTCALTAACLSIPLVWQWKRAESLEARLAELEHTRSGNDLGNNSSSAAAVSPDGSRKPGPAKHGGVAPGSSSGLRVPDPPAEDALAWRLRLDGPDRAEALTDRASAILSERNPARRLKLFSTFLDELRPGDYEAINAGFARQDQQGRLFGPEYQLFLAAAGTVDGHATMDSIFNWYHPNGGAPTGAQSGAMSSWAMEEPANAIAWWNAQEEGTTKNELAKSLISGLALKDIDLAWRCLNEFPENERAPFMGSLIRQQITDLGAEGAAGWLASLQTLDRTDPSPLRQQGFDALFHSLVNVPPDVKVRFLTQFVHEPWMAQSPYAGETAHQWATKNGPDAVAWAGALPDSLRMGALVPALSGWSQTQPREFQEWQARHGSEPQFQEAVDLIQQLAQANQSLDGKATPANP